MPPLRVAVQPRLQAEDWSLYWKEPMRTRTAVLDDLGDLDLPEGATPSDLAAAAARRLGWRPAARLARLEGFSAPFERCLLRGRLLDMGAPLEQQGVKDGDAVTYVRIELVAEGWKVGGQHGEGGLLPACLRPCCCLLSRPLWPLRRRQQLVRPPASGDKCAHTATKTIRSRTTWRRATQATTATTPECTTARACIERDGHRHRPQSRLLICEGNPRRSFPPQQPCKQQCVLMTRPHSTLGGSKKGQEILQGVCAAAFAAAASNNIKQKESLSHCLQPSSAATSGATSGTSAAGIS